MTGAWRWREDGEPVLDIGMPGFEVTPLRASDLQRWLELEADWINAPQDKREEVEAVQKGKLEECLNDSIPVVEAWRRGEEVTGSPLWMVRESDSGKAVARIGFNKVQSNEPITRRNIGWTTHPAYRRKGIAKNGVKAILEEYGKKTMKLHDVSAECRHDNPASIGVLRSVGFEKVREVPATLDDYREDLRGDGMIYEYIKVLNGDQDQRR